MDGSVDTGYGSCPPGSMKSPMTGYEGLAESQPPALQSDYTEVRMPPSEEGQAGDSSYLHGFWGDCSGCKSGVVIGLLFTAGTLFTLVVILLLTGEPEPGWMEILIAILWTLSSLWLYEIIQHQAHCKDYAIQNKILGAKKDELIDVQERLQCLQSTHMGSIEAAQQSMVHLRGTMRVDVVSAVENFTRVHARNADVLSCDTANRLLEELLGPIWEQHNSYQRNRRAVQKWITNGQRGGRSVDDIISFVQRVAVNDKQLECPDQVLEPVSTGRRQHTEDILTISSMTSRRSSRLET